MYRVNQFFIITALIVFAGCTINDQPDTATAATQIREMALADTAAFERLAYVCDTFGPRLSGSRNLEKALDWVLIEMKKDKLDNVHSEPVMVPHWVRGVERLELQEPFTAALDLLGLGGSIGTPPEGITAPALVVKDFDELLGRKTEVPGKIVVYNAPFTRYGETVMYRYRGAIEAARHGAVASLIRSVTPVSLNTPHTGGMAYSDTVRQIPQAAITVEAAEMLHRMTRRGQTPILKLTMEARTLPDSESRNVMAELKGAEKPEEIVVMGGHSDSWDVGQGAMDDAGGCVAAWEALRVIKALKLKPKRTIRVVFWVNEENGSRGGKAYQKAHEDEKHTLAIETDSGVFSPEGFGFTGPDDMRAKLKEIAQHLEPLGADSIFDHGGGTDINPLEEAGVPVMGLNVDGSKYFNYHHTKADMMDKLDRAEFNRCVAALATMAYLAANLD